MTKNEFVDKFLEVFAKNISSEKLKYYHIGKKKKDFLWNIFAANLIPNLSGDLARIEFDSVDKTDAIEIQYDNDFIGMSDDETVALSNKHMYAENIDNSGMLEFYVIGKDFSWCYVITHEGDLCGPFFCYAPV